MTTPVSMPAGHAILAADLDAYENLTSAWTTYTPTWASFGTQPVLNNGTLTGRYVRVGKLTMFTITLTPGTTTTFGTNEYTLTLPVAAVADFTCVALLQDTSTGFRYTGSAGILAGAALLNPIVFTNGTTGFTATSPVTLASTDIVRFSGLYEAA